MSGHIDMSAAPEGATHYSPDADIWYKMEEDALYYWNTDEWYASGCTFRTALRTLLTVPLMERAVSTDPRITELEGQIAKLQAEVESRSEQLAAAVVAAKSFGDDIQAMKRHARHGRYNYQVEANAASRLFAAMSHALEDLDVQSLADQLDHISRICDEQGNGADSKLCGDAASALDIVARAIEDWRGL